MVNTILPITYYVRMIGPTLSFHRELIRAHLLAAKQRSRDKSTRVRPCVRKSSQIGDMSALWRTVTTMLVYRHERTRHKAVVLCDHPQNVSVYAVTINLSASVRAIETISRGHGVSLRAIVFIIIKRSIYRHARTVFIISYVLLLLYIVCKTSR